MTVSDGELSDSQTLSVSVTDVYEAPPNSPPVITSNGGGNDATISIPENTKSVTTVQASDSDGDTITYSILNSLDSDKFTINLTSGVLLFSSAPDFETPTDSDKNNIYEVMVVANDGNLTDTQLLSISVTDVYEPPPNSPPFITSNGGDQNATISIPENTYEVTSFKPWIQTGTQLHFIYQEAWTPLK